MIYYVDIDETICYYESDREYPNALPMHERIAKINELYCEGNRVVYWTARGSTTGIDWTETTEKQLKDWGAKYHELKVKKPDYDVFICDKAINSDRFFKKCIKQS
tara:strand:- start:1685 stop:1999 length:315 start_codon:yes stop_codon:yes gene_type:complete